MTIRFKQICLIAATVFCSVLAHGQSKETQESLKVADDEDTEMSADDTACAAKCCKSTSATILFADLGGTSIMSKAGDNTTTAHGMSWAAGAQYAYKLNSCCCSSCSMYLSVGLEIRNFNSVISNTDWQGGTSYDNLHYWYAGIPVVFNIINTRPEACGWHRVRYYAQAGFTFSGNVYTNNVYSDQGDNRTYDLTRHYSTFMLRPFVGAGVTLHAGKSTYLLGPYVGYTATNILTGSNFKEHVLDFGLRFTTLLLKK